MKKKTIFWFYPHLKFWMGGTRFLVDISKYLAKNYQIYFVVSGKQNKNELIFKKFGEVIRLSQYTTNDLLYWLFFPLFLFYEIVKILFLFRKFRKELIYNSVLIGVSFPSNFIVFILSIFFRKKYLFLCYEPYPFFYNKDLIKNYSFLKKIFVISLSFLYSWLDKIAAKNAFEVITLDKYKASEIKKIYRLSPKVINVGVDTRLFSPSKKNNKTPHDEIFNKNIVFINSNDYTELKNLDVLINAFFLLNKEYKNIHLFITSTQPNSPRKKIYLNLVKKLNMQKYITFLDFLSQNDLATYYAKSFCYISANHNPITAGDWPVKEALSSQIFAIRSKVGTYDVIHKKTGYVFNKLSPEELKKAMLWVIKNKVNLEKNRKLTREVIIKYYNWNKVVNNLLELIDKI